MTKILVTGGTGFLGHHLVAALVDKGHQVRVLTRNEAKAHRVLPASVEFIEGDISNTQICVPAVADCETVYHLAAAFQEPEISRQRYYDVHVLGTRNLIDAARMADVGRFIHCSTVGVHGHVKASVADEESEHNPGDIYQVTKSQAETAALQLQRQYSLPISVARPTPIYGPGDMRLLKLFRLIANRRFVMLGSGNVFYHLIYVRDMTRGLMMLADNSESIGEVFIFGGRECVTLNELVAIIARELEVDLPKRHFPAWPVQILGSVVEAVYSPFNARPPIFRRRVDFFTKNRSFSTDKARRELGFEASTQLSDGIRETIRWYRQQGYL